MKPALAERAASWLDELGGISDSPDGLARTFLSPSHARARRLVARWMTSAGLTVFEDQAGNLIGRLEGLDPDAPVIVCGSHLDTVRNAGRFDGALGIVAGVLAAENLVQRGLERTRALEIVAFSDEEGVRFQTTYLGSRHYTGRLRAEELSARDAEGISVEDAISSHRPEFPPPPPRKTIAAYVEAHIEQGPVLEEAGLALGVVAAIAGQTRARIRVEGRAGHAGTTPMPSRRDALAGAAACIALIEQRALAAGGLVATVGELVIADPASNVIPGTVTFSLDVRDANDAVRTGFCTELFGMIESLLDARGLGVRMEILLESPATACSPDLTDALTARVIRIQGQCPRLVSGAGHDAVVLAEATDAAMLFVRCRDGLSHHPEESAAPADIADAIRVLTDFLADLLAP